MSNQVKKNQPDIGLSPSFPRVNHMADSELLLPDSSMTRIKSLTDQRQKGSAPLESFPIEILVSIAEQLDIASFVHLSMVSQLMQKVLKSRTVLIALVLHHLHNNKIPAASFPLSSMESNELYTLITRRHRTVWSAKAFPPRGHSREGDTREYPIATSALLPGGRWAVVLSGFRRHWHFSCYDLQTLVPGEFYQPVATLQLSPDNLEHSIYINQLSLSMERNTYNFILCSLPRGYRSALWRPRWNCFVRLRIDPITSVASISELPLPGLYHSHKWNLTLAGDFVAFESPPTSEDISLSKAFVWNSATDTISTATPARIPAEGLVCYPWHRFLCTNDGCVIELEALRETDVVHVIFTTWTQIVKDDDVTAPSTLCPSRVTRHAVHLAARKDHDSIHFDCEKWFETMDEVFIVLHITRGFTPLWQQLVLHKGSGIFHVLFTHRSPAPRGSWINTSPDYLFRHTPKTEAAVEASDSFVPDLKPDSPAKLHLQLRIAIQFGFHSWDLVVPASDDDSRFGVDSSLQIFCAWAGRWLLPTPFTNVEKDGYHYHMLGAYHGIVDGNTGGNNSIEAPPARKAYCRYMIAFSLKSRPSPKLNGYRSTGSHTILSLCELEWRARRRLSIITEVWVSKSRGCRVHILVVTTFESKEVCKLPPCAQGLSAPVLDTSSHSFMSTDLEGSSPTVLVGATSAAAGLGDNPPGANCSVIDGFPIEILVLIIENLNIASVVQFSMTSRSIYDIVHSHTVSAALALRCLSKEKIPTSSFPLAQMESSELFKLAIRRERMIWKANHQSSNDIPRGRRTNINLVIPEFKGAVRRPERHEDEDEDEDEYPKATSSVLPGGRWIVSLSGFDHWHFSCYDLQRLVPDHYYEPAATISIVPEQKDFPAIQRLEYCDEDSTFTFLISSQGMELAWNEIYSSGWHCIIRLRIDPLTSLVSMHHVPLPDFYHTRDWYLNLSGDFISFETLDSYLAYDNLAPSRALLWNWRHNVASNEVPRQIPANNVMRRGRFIPTPDGSLIELEALASETVVKLFFTIWTQSCASDGTLEHHGAHSIDIALSPATTEEKVPYVRLEKWDYRDSSHDVFIILNISTEAPDWEGNPLYLMFNRNSGAIRILYHRDSPSPALRDITVPESPHFFFKFSIPPMVVGLGRPIDRRRHHLIEMGAAQDEFLEASLIFVEGPKVVLIFPAMDEDGDRSLTRDDAIRFCSRSGRWLLSAQLYTVTNKEDEEDDETASMLPVRKSFCPYIVVDPLE
ncbi:hypothetical protein DL93DRAFT_2230476 [Clavulina sp. PMI_390]|nr:hypothetical protein DL93DRAFT_2230476 [Clavulina sp. PMI_390]